MMSRPEERTSRRPHFIVLEGADANVRKSIGQRIAKIIDPGGMDNRYGPEWFDLDPTIPFESEAAKRALLDIGRSIFSIPRRLGAICDSFPALSDTVGGRDPEWRKKTEALRFLLETPPYLVNLSVRTDKSTVGLFEEWMRKTRGTDRSVPVPSWGRPFSAVEVEVNPEDVEDSATYVVMRLYWKPDVVENP